MGRPARRPLVNDDMGGGEERLNSMYISKKNQMDVSIGMSDG